MTEKKFVPGAASSWDRQRRRETGLRRLYAAKDTVESAKGIAKTMLIDRLQSLIAVSVFDRSVRSRTQRVIFTYLNNNKHDVPLALPRNKEIIYYV